MKVVRLTTHVVALIFVLAPLIGCGLLSPYKKNKEGFYPQHYNCCGPVALEKAFHKFYKDNDLVVTQELTREEISKKIQRTGMGLKEALTFFNKNAICITWPVEIRRVAEQYGFQLINIDDIDKLDPEKDVAIVLVHGSFFSQQYHWVVFPVDAVRTYYGDETVIDKIYLLKLKK